MLGNSGRQVNAASETAGMQRLNPGGIPIAG